MCTHACAREATHRGAGHRNVFALGVNTASSLPQPDRSRFFGEARKILRGLSREPLPVAALTRTLLAAQMLEVEGDSGQEGAGDRVHALILLRSHARVD